MAQIKTVPRIESYKSIFKFVENPMPIIGDAIKTYGSTYYTRIVGGTKIVMTVDAGLAQHVLQKNHRNYHKSALQTESLGRYIGNGLLTSNGEYWLRQRRLIQPGFHKEKLEGLINIMHDEIKIYCEELRGEIDARGGKKIIDVNEAMMELTLRIVSKALFSTGISAERITELGRTFTKLQQQIVKEVRQPLFNWWRVLSGKRKKTHELAEDTKSIMREIINARKKANVSSDDLLDMLLSTRYEDNNEPMSDQQLLDETIILFVAGHETTANTLAWTLYGTHDQHTVIDSIKENATELLSRKISMDEISTKGYLDQVLQESMRMYPPAWILDRVALEDDSFGDVKINKGDMIGIYVYGVHHNEEYWQDDLTFDPERFANGKSSVHPYAFIPFGGGPRLCIGHHFAMIEMKLAIAELMHQFEWTLQPGQQVDFVPLITLRPRNNIWMEVKCRQLD